MLKKSLAVLLAALFVLVPMTAGAYGSVVYPSANGIKVITGPEQLDDLEMWMFDGGSWVAYTSATSYLINQWANYHCDNLFDCNPTTAWCDGIDGGGIGSSVWSRWETDPDCGFYMYGIAVRNGLQTKREAFNRNDRARQIELQIDDHYYDVTLLDCYGWQVLLFDNDLYVKDSVDIGFTVLSTYSGDGLMDICVSDFVPLFRPEPGNARFCGSVNRPMNEQEFFSLYPGYEPFTGHHYASTSHMDGWTTGTYLFSANYEEGGDVYYSLRTGTPIYKEASYDAGIVDIVYRDMDVWVNGIYEYGGGGTAWALVWLIEEENVSVMGWIPM